MLMSRAVDHVLFFFFQAEDGIRDLTVTGVQTCALPISGAGTCSSSRRKRARSVAWCARGGGGEAWARAGRSSWTAIPFHYCDVVATTTPSSPTLRTRA